MEEKKFNKEAADLANNYSSYDLAEMLLKSSYLLSCFDLYEDCNFDYRASPFCDKVKGFLDNIEDKLPEVSYRTIKYKYD